MPAEFPRPQKLMRQLDKQSPIGRSLVVIFLGISIMYFIFNYLSQNQMKNSNKLTSPAVLSLKNSSNDSLESAVGDALKGTNGQYAVVIKNLGNNKTYYLNEHQSFDAGSLYKLWVMADVFEQIKNGSLKESDILSEDTSVLNSKFNISEEVAELTKDTITLSVSDALQQMIIISHNYAGLLLTQKVRLSTVSSFLQRNGFKESKVGLNGESPTTTATDIAMFFEKLYKGEIINKEYSDKMLEILKRQQLNDKIPKLLPIGLSIAHKTGEVGYFSHDAGIVFDKSANYIIVVLSETNIPAAAEGRISQISKEVYDYFSKGP